jgi:hypothetical protein
MEKEKKEPVVEVQKVELREEEEREVAHPTEQVENPIA